MEDKDFIRKLLLTGVDSEKVDIVLKEEYDEFSDMMNLNDKNLEKFFTISKFDESEQTFFKGLLNLYNWLKNDVKITDREVTYQLVLNEYGIETLKKLPKKGFEKLSETLKMSKDNEKKLKDHLYPPLQNPPLHNPYNPSMEVGGYSAKKKDNASIPNPYGASITMTPGFSHNKINASPYGSSYKPSDFKANKIREKSDEEKIRDWLKKLNLDGDVDHIQKKLAESDYDVWEIISKMSSIDIREMLDGIEDVSEKDKKKIEDDLSHDGIDKKEIATLKDWLEEMELGDHYKNIKNKNEYTIDKIKIMRPKELKDFAKALLGTKMTENMGKILTSWQTHFQLAPSIALEAAGAGQNSHTGDLAGTEADVASKTTVAKQQSNQTPVKILRQQKLAVCKIDFVEEPGCGSGFYAKFGDKIGIMTNNHVFNSKEQVLKRKAIFNFKRKNQFVIWFDPETFFWTDRVLDASFCAIKDHDELLKKHKVKAVDLSEIRRQFKKGDLVHIYQHPKGNPKAKSTANISDVRKRYIWYLCDTEPGSSGSPVFLGSRIVGLHHAARSVVDKLGKKVGMVNEAIKIVLVIEGFKKFFNEQVAQNEGIKLEKMDENDYVEADINNLGDEDIQKKIEGKIDVDSEEREAKKRETEQLEAVCLINLPWGAVLNWTGFYAKFRGRTGIVTSNWLLGQKKDCDNVTASFFKENKEKVIDIQLQPDKLFEPNEILDITFVGCKDEALKGKIEPLSLDDCYEPNIEKNIHLFLYNKGKKKKERKLNQK